MVEKLSEGTELSQDLLEEEVKAILLSTQCFQHWILEEELVEDSEGILQDSVPEEGTQCKLKIQT